MTSQEWTTIISHRRRWFDTNFRELWQYRDLILLFIRRDLIAAYKQTILGPFWILLQPLVTTFVFTVVFGKIIGVSTGGVPQALFFLSGVVIWNYFAACLGKTSDVLVANAGLFKKAYFPRMSVPIATVIGNAVPFFVQLALFVMVYCYSLFKGSVTGPNLAMLFLPLIILHIAALGFGMGLLISALTTKYRDLAFMTGMLIQFWMYATPVVYPLEMVPNIWRWVYMLNHMTASIETFRYAFWGGINLSLQGLIIAVAETAILLVLAVGVFSRVEKNFVDTV